MDVPPGFTGRTKNMVCRLTKSLYELKQSPRAWFGRFSLVMRKHRFSQSNSDHTLFLKRNGEKTVALIIYIDDMIVTGNDEDEISELQKYIASEFEMKDRGGLKYFLGIEVYKSKLGIFLSQRKYVLDLLDKYVRLQTCRNTNHTKSLFSKYPDQVPTNKE
jgi:hypothetical protein